MWELWGVEISPLPLKRHIAYTTACCYRTSCEDGNVLDTNRYVIAQPNSDGHLRGADVLRKYSVQCGAKYPQALRGTQLCKHVATISQVLNLRENKIELLAQFMGHNIKVHREYYRRPSDILHTAKVSKVLLVMENGQSQQLTGK